jgi:hypothetical protein
MCTKFVRLVLFGSILTLTFPACAPPPVGGGVDEQATALAATISAIQGTISAMQTLPAPSPTLIPTVTLANFPTPTLANTPAPLFIVMTVIVTAAPTQYQTPNTENATVNHDALCWLGPGPGFVVSSAIRAGTRVIFLGSTTLSGWWVISNPIYHDPCWIYQQDLTIDPGVNPAVMKVFTPPPTFTPTSVPTSTSTPTPTPTP